MQLATSITNLVPQLQLLEDNQAMVRMCESDRNPTMRHVPRARGLSVAWLRGRFQQECYNLVYCDTKVQMAHIYTKVLADPNELKRACTLAGVVEPRGIRTTMNWQANRNYVASGNRLVVNAQGCANAAAEPCSLRGVLGDNFVVDGPSNRQHGIQNNSKRCNRRSNAQVLS
jgi:hypothetical protein